MGTGSVEPNSNRNAPRTENFRDLIGLRIENGGQQQHLSLTCGQLRHRLYEPSIGQVPTLDLLMRRLKCERARVNRSLPAPLPSSVASNVNRRYPEQPRPSVIYVFSKSVALAPRCRKGFRSEVLSNVWSNTQRQVSVHDVGVTFVDDTERRSVLRVAARPEQLSISRQL